MTHIKSYLFSKKWDYLYYPHNLQKKNKPNKQIISKKKLKIIQIIQNKILMNLKKSKLEITKNNQRKRQKDI